MEITSTQEQKDQLRSEIEKALPSRKNSITEEALDIIVESQTEAAFQGESLLQSATTYENVMIKNKVSITEYLNALKFCAYLFTMEENFTEAYKKTFYSRDFVHNRLGADTGSTAYKELTSAASRYRKSKLVVDILTLSQVPLDLMFTGARYKALGVLSDIMVTAKYDRDKINAAKELLAATKGPDNVNVALEMGLSTEAKSMQMDLNNQLAQISANQKAMLEGGMDITDVQTLGITAEFTEADVDE